MQGSTPRAHYALAVLTLINFFNYLDRYVMAGVLPKVEHTFSLNHSQAGWLFLVFMAVYTVASPVSGFLGDRYPRRWVIAGSVLLWSLATLGSGLSRTFDGLLWMRALTGIGEAGYGVVAPAVIADLYPREKRTRMLSLFFAALPLGAAAGFLIGGAVSDAWSWQAAFLVSGAPGLLLAAFALFVPEPARGATDAAPPVAEASGGFAALRGNRLFWVSTGGLTLMTFSMGGLAAFMPTFLETERSMSGTRAGLLLGAITATAGLFGTLIGGLLGERLDRRWESGGVVLSGVGLLLAAPLMVAVARLHAPAPLFLCLFAVELLLFLNTGPLNAAVVSCVPAGARAFAVGVQTLILHLFGDAASPKVIGWIGARWSLARAIELNAVPVLLGAVVLMGGVYFGRRT